MKVGDYVRFKDKRGNIYIRKIVEIPEDNRYASIYIDKDANYSNGLSPKNIIKSSPNIIDLIEVGDYVNGTIVTKVVFDEIECKYIELDYTYNKRGIREKDIKSIVTREMFESMEYKVEV